MGGTVGGAQRHPEPAVHGGDLGAPVVVREAPRGDTCVVLAARLAELQAEVAAAKAANQKVQDTHDYDEAATRDTFIDLLLKEAGWDLAPTGADPAGKLTVERPVTGMQTASGNGFVDYVLWGVDGKPLAVVEAKRTSRDPRDGQQQAKLYADALAAEFNRRPVIFYTNGYETYLWDDGLGYPPRRVQGFLTHDQLHWHVRQRAGRLSLTTTPVNERIAGRPYQLRAIKRVGETYERDRQRQALLVMATGTGKTRTTVALVDQLKKAGWAQRVLFLADREALVIQTMKAFKEHLPNTPVASLLDDKSASAHVFVSTYQTMMNQIDVTDSAGRRRFGPGYFDLIVIDEAHRSVYAKYGAIFRYFDSLLLGLTATPKDEIDRNTYKLFQLEDGVPTDSYGLDEAVGEGYLVPPKAVKVPLKFMEHGIRYDDLSEEEKAEWDAKEWSEDGEKPDAVSRHEMNTSRRTCSGRPISRPSPTSLSCWRRQRARSGGRTSPCRCWKTCAEGCEGRPSWLTPRPSGRSSTPTSRTSSARSPRRR
ncbi:DEAD/DEAH box helicase family protein [Streptomyces sp. NPDC002911]